MTGVQSSNEKRKVVVLSGPTGSGKSALAVRLCKQNDLPNFEIVIADSRQIFIGMDIGTDKPDRETRQSIPHHLVDILTPAELFSAGQYRDVARKTIAWKLNQNSYPLIVGGTGLYLRALLGGLADVGSKQIAVRKRIKQILKEKGIQYLYSELKSRDRNRADKINANDTYRIIRALEMLESGTGNISKALRDHAFQDQPYEFIFFVLSVDRSQLYNRIESRVDRMIENGLLNEVTELVEKYGKNAAALNAIGYKQIIMYQNGEITLDEAIRLIKRDTRRFAKRQLTWFRRENYAEWIQHDPDSPMKTVKTIKGRIKTFIDD